MSLIKKIKDEGISLRQINVCLIVLAVVVTSLLIVATYQASSMFNELSEMTDEYIEMHDLAEQLMEASDYLTEMVQRYTLNGEKVFLDQYFEEALVNRRREKAIEKMSENSNEVDALERLKEAMNESMQLMNQEYYAMKLVLVAKDTEVYPDELKNVTLSKADAALSAGEKMKLAQGMVLGDEYYVRKERIRERMHESLEKIEKTTHDRQEQAKKELFSQLKSTRFLILFQTISLLCMIWLTTKLGINPVLKAVENIREDHPIPIIGANEFRYLARTYNKMYTMYKNSVASLNYKASHDPLTKVYNRSGYDLIMTSIDLQSSCMFIIDIDKFKQVNDTYGHEIGDEAIKRVASAISKQFRSDDYVCRIGGDEFVVIMIHMEDKRLELVKTKINRINEILEQSEDGFPKLSVSAGIAFGQDVSTPKELFECADLALYETKRHGRHGFSIYCEEMSSQAGEQAQQQDQ